MIHLTKKLYVSTCIGDSLPIIQPLLPVIFTVSYLDAADDLRRCTTGGWTEVNSAFTTPKITNYPGWKLARPFR